MDVCTGISAASVAWHRLQWNAYGLSEIDSFACDVLKHHYSNVPNFGNMDNYREWPGSRIDLLCGGTPCQSFSLAGLRKGLGDPRGNLMLTYLAIAATYRPKWMVWENVPGVLSSGEGQDFACFLRGLAELGYGFAYRILDAQFFGIPQRRRRVFVVGCLGSWQRAAAVLFERQSLQGNPAPSREAREEIAATITARVSNGGRGHGARSGHAKDSTLIRVAPTLSESSGHARPGDNLQSIGYLLPITMAHGQGGAEIVKDGAPSLTCNHEAPILANFRTRVRRLTPRECERLQGFPDDYTLIPRKGGKLAKDGPRYKALGNSMAVPVMRWIGQRIDLVDAIKAAA